MGDHASLRLGLEKEIEVERCVARGVEYDI
jgi:hypothetical protein